MNETVKDPVALSDLFLSIDTEVPHRSTVLRIKKHILMERSCIFRCGTHAWCSVQSCEPVQQ